jgi:hypothetical protein
MNNQMKILYKSLFRGWVEITEEQKQKLIKHMNNGITSLSEKDKQNYINNRFIVKQ